jgi:hypothetical protein
MTRNFFDLNGEATRVRKKQNSAIIASDVRRFGQGWSSWYTQALNELLRKKQSGVSNKDSAR